jgi:hypothetical protein
MLKQLNNLCKLTAAAQDARYFGILGFAGKAEADAT